MKPADDGGVLTLPGVPGEPPRNLDEVKRRLVRVEWLVWALLLERVLGPEGLLRALLHGAGVGV